MVEIGPKELTHLGNTLNALLGNETFSLTRAGNGEMVTLKNKGFLLPSLLCVHRAGHLLVTCHSSSLKLHSHLLHLKSQSQTDAFLFFP